VLCLEVAEMIFECGAGKRKVGADFAKLGTRLWGTSDAGQLGLLATHGLPKPKTGSSGTVETARTARLNKLKRDAVEIGKREAALKHADGEEDEEDEDVVPWKALLINNWKEKNNDVERRASEANSSLTEREIAIDERKQEVEERKLKMEELHKTKMGNVGGTAGEGGGLTIEKCEARMDALKQDIVDAKVEGDDEAVEMLRGTLKKAREKYCKMVEEEME